MGLDMYLTKKTYVKNWDHMGDKEKHAITVSQNGKPVDHIQPERISYIEEEIGYWRKANAIHAWFVENVQEGKDDCETYYVSGDDLKSLLADVQEVLASSELIDGVIHVGSTRSKNTGGEWEPILEDGKIVDNANVAEEVLPTTKGFFFGSTDYDEYYIADLKDTKRIIEQALKDREHGSIYYSSSW